MVKMIKITVLLSAFTLFALSAYSQTTPINRTVRVIQEGKTVQTSITTKKINRLSENKLYFWFSNQNIYSNYGGYKGDLLNGEYVEFDTMGRLILKGYFSFGLKTGKWIYWNRQGMVVKIINWKNGIRQGKSYEYSDTGEELFKGYYLNNQLHGKTISLENDSLIINRYRFGKIKIKKKEVKLEYLPE